MMSPAMIVLGLCMLGISTVFSSAVLHNTQEVQLEPLTGSNDGSYDLENLTPIADITDSESSEGDDLLWTSGTKSMLSMMSPGVEIRKKRKPSVCRCKGTVCHCCGSDAGILLCVNIKYSLGYFHVKMYAMNKLFYTGAVMYQNPKLLCGHAMGFKICIRIEDGKKHSGKVYGCLKIRSPVPKSFPCFRMNTRSLLL